MKAPDLIGAYACSACHDVVDRRRPLPVEANLTRQDVELAFAEGVFRSLRMLVDQGLVKAS